jgi:hypothetical protein
MLRSRDSVSTQIGLRQLNVSRIGIGILILGASCGIFMGWYALFGWSDPEWRQMVSSGFKVPALYLPTLFVCLPSLCVFSTLAGSRFTFTEVLQLLLAISAIAVVVLASFGPIVAFFELSTTNHGFMKLLNVGTFALAGLFGMATLWRALKSLFQSLDAGGEPGASSAGAPPVIPPMWVPRPRASNPAKRIFAMWMVIYAVVGAQMS